MRSAARISLLILSLATISRAARVSAFGPAPDIWRDVAQRDDKSLRQRSLDQVYTWLAAGTTGQKMQALLVLPRVKDVPFDRARFLAAARTTLTDPAPEIRAATLMAL